ncbi:heterokaryon incompatibility protein-domain-containing protein [Lasiosphaeris hirsuta]|uniref:Heterokaryon incompatibility protein-domain-containing protein n=1 Tax=Lasiosphaeris hirsuta TaxID=260670 RepID=A0AA40DJJ1_9PEZI|nr:heterokaryon incompatibility protein-domain-containing protein [Lasiosphaeris hirsuta]
MEATNAPALVADGDAFALSKRERPSTTPVSTRCKTCLDLDYARYISVASQSAATIGAPASQARYRLARFDHVQESAAGGCSVCRILQHAIDFFWNVGERKAFRKPLRAITRHFTRILCIAQQPGCGLLLFRVLFFDDAANVPTIHALTVRDSTSRIEFYRDASIATEPAQQVGHAPIGFASHVHATITLDRAVALASKWLHICTDSHQKCSPDPSTLPKRVIDVLEGVRLVDTLVEPDLALDEPYMTLSHCWGSQRVVQTLKTTHGTMYQHRQQIPWHTLPRLFRDAILLVRALKCRYVWIDSLCIIQDDHEDWMVESTKMAEIYQNATLNIAATAMRNGSVGLFQPRLHGQGFRVKDLKGAEQETMADSLETIEIDGINGRPVFSRISHDRSHEVLYGDIEYFRTPMEPLLSRAWVFQERLLSRRTLHFGASELLWECRACCFCECTRIGHADALSVRNLNSNPKNGDPDSDLGDIDTSALFVGPKKVLFFNICGGLGGSQPVLDFWLRAVQEYSFLLLSRELDRPFALAGIAKRIQGLAGGTYLAGLWASDLPRALLWAPYRSKEMLRSDSGVPTWSWMTRSCFPHSDASACAVRYKHVTQHPFVADSRLQIHDEGTFCRYESSNPFGRPLSGQMRISAASWWATVEQASDGRPSKPRWNGRNTLYAILEGTSGKPAVLIPFMPDCPGKDPQTVRLEERVLCVLFGSREVEPGAKMPQFFLALAPVPGRDGVYQRVGFCETEDRVPEFGHAEVKTVKII